MTVDGADVAALAYGESHHTITRADWERGRGVCSKCGRKIDLVKDHEHLSQPIRGSGEEIRTFNCPSCTTPLGPDEAGHPTTTHFHIREVVS
jgi:hypothetical protein